MAAVNWLPFAVRVGELTRGAALPMDVVLSSTHSLQPKHLLSLLLPFFPVAPFPGTEVDITFRGIYLGGAALSLAVVCVTWSRGFIVAALAGAAVGSLLMSLGGNFFGRVALHAMVPLFNFSQYPAGDSTFLAMARAQPVGGRRGGPAGARAPAVAGAGSARVAVAAGAVPGGSGGPDADLRQVRRPRGLGRDVRGASACCWRSWRWNAAAARACTRCWRGWRCCKLGYSAMVNFDVAGQPMPTAEYAAPPRQPRRHVLGSARRPSPAPRLFEGAVVPNRRRLRS